MKCPTCNNKDALFLTESKTCNKCTGLVTKTPVQGCTARGPRGPYKKRVKKPRPMKIVGEFTGKVKYFHSVEDTAEFLDVLPETVRNLTKTAPTNRVHWFVEYCSMKEYEAATRVPDEADLGERNLAKRDEEAEFGTDPA